MTQQTETNDMVITLTVKVLISQCAFLLKTEGLMKVDRALIKRQRLSTNFV